MAFSNQSKNYTEYDKAITYAIGEVVFYNSQLYVCKLEALDKIPTNTTYWNVLFENQTKNTATFTNQTKN